MSPAVGDRWVPERAAPTPGRICKDCYNDPANGPKQLTRPAPHPGPRCTTHHNAKKRADRLRAKGRRVENKYGLTPEQYDALYEFQGGQCALRCGATGASKRLAVDHDHQQAMRDGHDPNKGCPSCVRGLVCGPCNDVLAHARSNPAYFARGAAYLEVPPWKRLRVECSP